MNLTEYQRQDAVGLSQLVARGDVSPDELLDAALARMTEVNPMLNAVVDVFEAHGRAAIKAGLPDGPFRGVPYLLKNVTTQLAGTVTTGGSRVFANAVAAEDSALVAAYKRAGFVIFGKTNTPEFGLVAITEPELHGPTLNPWNLERTCGGSSGGAASAVAAGIVPAAQASDGGGSIRIPASCCGLFGFKPSRGRVSMAPGGEGWGGLAVLHAVTRSVRDSAAILDASCMPVAGDPYFLAPPELPFRAEVERDPPKLRIGVIRQNLNGSAMDAACTQGLADAARLCESLGHDMVETTPPKALEALLPTMLAVVAASVAANLDREAGRRGRAIADDEIEPITRLLYGRARDITGVQYALAVQAMHQAGRLAAQWFEQFDVLLLPTLGRLPLEIGILKGGLGDIDALSAKFADYAPNTQLFNVSGQPAMSVPLGLSAERLPVGIQFAARAAQDGLLFRLAGQLERAQPWANQRPPAPFGL
jgi:amidase